MAGLAACAAPPQVEPSVTPLIVYVTPAPTPTPRPTPEPTIDIRPDWFAAACEATSHLRNGFDAWIEAVDRADQGDPDDVLDWVGNADSFLFDAQNVLDAIPEWEEGRSFTNAAQALHDALEQELSRIEHEPLVEMSSSTFTGVLDLRSDLFFAADAVPGTGSPGCDLRWVVS